MSGPWDRPSSEDADAWPSEDLGPSGAGDGARDRTSPSASGAARDPATEGAPAWDDWPAPPPPQDEYYVDEPIPPSSDPWAESWSVEEADAMLGSAARGREREQWSEPAPDWRPEPQPPGLIASEPEPPSEPGPGPDAVPDVPPEPEPAARIEPWSPDIDPWRFEPEAPSEPAEPASEEVAAAPFASAPTASEAAEPEAVEADPSRLQAPDDPAVPSPPEAPGPDAVPEPVIRWPTPRDELPDWLADPIAPPATGAETADPVEMTAAEVEPEAEREPEPEAEAAPAIDATPEPEPVAAIGEPGAAEPDAAPPVEEPAPPSVPFWKSILPWRSAEPDAPAVTEPLTEAKADAVGAEAPEAVEAHVGGEIEAEPDAEPSDVWPEEPDAGMAAAAGIEPAWGSDLDAAEEQRADEADRDAPAFVPITGGLTYGAADPWPDADAESAGGTTDDAWSPPSHDVWADVAATAAASQVDATSEPMPEPEPELEPRWDQQPEPEPEPVPEPVRTAAATGWGDPEWSDRGESTRVLPTDWTAPQPERAVEADELQAAAIRTRLTEPDPDLEEEEPATVAEQAVPWLIGVILLLAGMVIVLLALIFAGDGSLGGGADASPSISPTLAAVAATPSPTPSASATPAESSIADPTQTPEPTPTSPPAPEYGALEMVYQGRSAALAPIYLLHRDFTLEQDSEVLAQDAELDVRRFAWSPDGRAGAALLADVLVSVEPGKEKRPLGDGLSAVTFGEDRSTVYAVRVTEDGNRDVATVVAIDFESGDTADLASVDYRRPDVGTEPALEEAAFTDDGGTVRLYWTAQDRLHLWVLGAGAWTIDPSDGAVSRLEGEPLPVLWSPDGKQRIELTEDGNRTTLSLRNANNRALTSVEVRGIVSHVRWAPASNRVAFTLGRSTSNGGILQDLFIWDLKDGVAPTPLTSTGAAFGAEWLGTQPMWREE